MTTPDFVLRLRKKIGHDPLWLIGVTAIVRDGQGRYLLARRADTGMWAFVAGVNEPTEQPADTVIREVKEETGVDVRVDALVSVTSLPRMLVYANGDHAQYMDHCFVCSLRPGGNADPGIGDHENTDSGWFSRDALPSPLATQSASRLAVYERWLARPAAADGGRGAVFFSDLEGNPGPSEGWDPQKAHEK